MLKHSSVSPVVVVTGASAGIGRASALAFARRGARVVLLARGESGLNASLASITDEGGIAMAIPTDMADFEQVAAAGKKVADEFGPIDIWVNVAFVSVFAPFDEVSASEFQRVTEVSYLGYVHGTMVALQQMKQAGKGTIVQVGSALGSRSIPLQAAYCGAKHAINGFTESLRCELLADKSPIKVTVVQMPAVNTPQFSWVLSRLPLHPQPVPPIYQPEVAARAVVHAALHPNRKQYWVGASTTGTLLAQKLAPAMLDRYLARTGIDAQQTNALAPNPTSNLWHPADGVGGSDFGTHGDFDDRSHAHSAQAFLSRHARIAAGVTLLAGLAGMAIPRMHLVGAPRWLERCTAKVATSSKNKTGHLA